MVKFTHFPCREANAPSLVLIPGGPGLSSLTLHSLAVLCRSFNLQFVDLPGTNGVTYDKNRTFSDLSDEISSKVMKLDGTVFILGHSFGGFLAAKVALSSPNIAGLVCISTPFTRLSLNLAGQNYAARMSPVLTAAEKKWRERPSDSSLAEWLAEYGELYFSQAKLVAGQEMLKHDPVSHRLFLSLRQDAEQMEPLLDALASWSGKKLFLAGENDTLLPAEALRADSTGGGFAYHSIPGAHHFVMFDQPESVAGVIEEVLATEFKGKL